MNPEATISAGVTTLLASVTGLMVFETIRLARFEPPITWYTRGVVRHWPRRAIVVGGAGCFAVGLLYSHFVWDAVRSDPRNPAT